MIISLIGSHGTGKTAVFSALKTIRPDFNYFSEGVRKQVPAFGFKTPYEIVEKFGIGTFEVMNINSWSVIDPQINSALDPRKTVITDRSAIDNYAYYLALRKTETDLELEEFIKNMVKHYSGLVDIFVYFPIGIIPLEGDDMRPEDKEYQEEVDKYLKESFDILGINKLKMHTLKSITIKERASEILDLLN